MAFPPNSDKERPNVNDYQQRISTLKTKMKAEEVSLTLLAGTDAMRYLTGWREGGHERFVGLFVPQDEEQRAAFVVPAMNAPQALKTPAEVSEVFGWSDESGWYTEVQTLFSRYEVDSGSVVLIDDELLSVHLLAMQSLFPGVRFAPAGRMMASLRQIKTASELASMERAALLIDEIFEATVIQLKAGINEMEMREIILQEIKRRNTSPSFSPLVCFGANAALPHHHTGTTTLKSGDVVILDLGCVWEHYASDITRTVCFGTPSDPDAAKVYEIVYRAHSAVMENVKPGTSGERADRFARDVITKAEYGEFFVHRTGHGIGLSTHEPPYIVEGNHEPLLPGMCFSDEPGIYLPGRFGVRIENIVTMTETGLRSLNTPPSPTLRTIGL